MTADLTIAVLVGLYLLTGVLVREVLHIRTVNDRVLVCVRHERLHMLTREQWREAVDKMLLSGPFLAIGAVSVWPAVVVFWFVFIRPKLEP